MKKLRKILAAALALALVLAVTACNTGGSPADTAPPADTDDADNAPAGEEPAVEAPADSGDSGDALQFWYWDINMEDAYGRIVADFTAQTGVEVVSSITPWADYWTKLQTALPSGAGPDVFWLNHPNAVTYMPTGELLDITSAVNDGTVDMSVFEQNIVDPYTLDGAYYGVPIFVDTIAMFYNKAIFAEAGIDPPQDGWTWDDMLEIAQQLTITDDNGNTTQYGIAMSSSTQSFTGPMIMQNGGQFYTEDGMECIIDSPQNRETIQFMLDLSNVYGVSPTNQEILEMTVLTMMQNGMTAMSFCGLWNVAPVYEALGDDFGLAPLPQKVQKGSIFHNLGYVGSSKTSNPAGVIAFMDYATSAEHGNYVAEVFLPARIDTRQGWFDNYPTLDLYIYSDAIEYSTKLTISGRNAGSAYTILDNELERIFTGTEVGDGLAELQETINEEINR